MCMLAWGQAGPPLEFLIRARRARAARELEKHLASTRQSSFGLYIGFKEIPEKHKFIKQHVS